MGITIPQVVTESSASGAQAIDGSLNFDGSKSQSLKRTVGSGNKTTWTWSAWVKTDPNQVNSSGGFAPMFFGGLYNTSGQQTHIAFGGSGGTSGQLLFTHYDSSYTTNLRSSSRYRDIGWYHIVVVFDSNNGTSGDRARVYVNGERVTTWASETYPSPGGTTWINDSSKFHGIGKDDKSATENCFDGRMSQCYFIDGLALDASYFGYTDGLTNTWRPKKYKVELAQTQTVTVQPTYVSNSAVLDPTNAFDGSSGTEATYSGVGSWLSFTVSDASNLTVPFRIRNDSSGTGQTVAMFTDSGGSSAVSGSWGSTGNNTLSPAVSTTVEDTYTFPSTGTYYLRHTVGSDSNIFVYKIGGSVTTTTGGNSFYLPMDGNSPIGEDKSGNGNNWTAVNFSGTSIDPDISKDSPSGAVSGGRAQTGITTTSSAPSNYATLNPLDTTLGGNLRDGNLKAVGSSNWSVSHARGTFALTYGKWFWEGTKSGGGSTGQFGFANSSANLTEGYSSAPANSWTFYFGNGTEIIVPAANSGGYFSGSAMTDGDTAGVALDMDNGTWQFFKNGVGGAVKTLVDTDSGSTASITELYPYVGSYDSNIDLNFGQKPFKYAPPQGHLPLNSASATPETVITRPDQFVDVSTWTGDGSSNRLINVGLQPDLVWVKRRSTSSNHVLMDTIRGHSKGLYSNLTSAEQNDSSINEFNSNGFTVNGNGDTNQSSQTFVGWSWKAGGSKNTFNVDDVGYANASDVNMSVGSLNSVSYDKSVTWSSTSGMSTPANAFDGSFSTGATVSSSGSPITVTTGSFTASSISFYKNGNNDANLATVTINNTIVRSFPLQSTATGWVTVDLGSEVTVTSLKTTWYGAYTLYAVKYDTKLLVDNGTTTQDVPSIAATGASVGTKQGFSIVKWTGTGANATINHGLNSKPGLVIVKNTGATASWAVWVTSLSGSQFLGLNTTNAIQSSAAYWNSAEPTSSIINVGTDSSANGNGNTMIAYVWHDVPGLQKFGKYTGNGAADGPFVGLSFRPAWLMIKQTDAADGWMIYDNNRSTFNLTNKRLMADTSGQEYTGNVVGLDLLSNGFKIRTSDDDTNASNGTYIYAAFAEAPAFNLFGGQSNAR